MNKCIKFEDFELEGIYMNDYPDFCDAYISSGTAILDNGETRDATDAELDELNNDTGLVSELVFSRVF